MGGRARLETRDDVFDDFDRFFRAERDRYKSKFLGFTTELTKQAGQAGINLVAKLAGGTAEVFDVKKPSVIARIADTLGKRSKLINQHTADVIKRELTDALQNVESIQEIRDRLTAKYAEMSEGRAENIARTEVLNASSSAELEGYKQMGVERKEWIAELDDRTRDTHAEADGQVVGIEEPFVVGASLMEAPGLGDDPGEVCNCRCTVAPVASED